jgi:hypothetical protein
VNAAPNFFITAENNINIQPTRKLSTPMPVYSPDPTVDQLPVGFARGPLAPIGIGMPGDWLGFTLHGGDFNGAEEEVNPLVDLLIGAPHGDDHYNSHGAAYLVYGPFRYSTLAPKLLNLSAGGTLPTALGSNPVVKFTCYDPTYAGTFSTDLRNSATPVRLHSYLVGGTLGWCVYGGDLNGDDIDDIIFSAQYASWLDDVPKTPASGPTAVPDRPTDQFYEYVDRCGIVVGYYGRPSSAFPKAFTYDTTMVSPTSLIIGLVEQVKVSWDSDPNDIRPDFIVKGANAFDFIGQWVEVLDLNFATYGPTNTAYKDLIIGTHDACSATGPALPNLAGVLAGVEQHMQYLQGAQWAILDIPVQGQPAYPGQ